jgi:hypothetical protein
MFFYDRKTRHVDCCSMYTNGVSLLTSVTKRLKDGKMLLMSKWIRANIPVGFGRLEAAHTTCNAVETQRNRPNRSETDKTDVELVLSRKKL